MPSTVQPRRLSVIMTFQNTCERSSLFSTPLRIAAMVSAGMPFSSSAAPSALPASPLPCRCGSGNARAISQAPQHLGIEFHELRRHGDAAALNLLRVWIVDGAGDAIRLRRIAGVVVAVDGRADALAELLAGLGADRFAQEEPVLKISRRGRDRHARRARSGSSPCPCRRRCRRPGRTRRGCRRACRGALPRRSSRTVRPSQ